MWLGIKSNAGRIEKMSDLKEIYALWYLKFKVYQRERSRMVASIVNPVLWLVIFAWFLFNEPVNMVNLGGVLLILFGFTLIFYR
jgi:drug/metabolite transporter (DMT)-like permease